MAEKITILRKLVLFFTVYSNNVKYIHYSLIIDSSNLENWSIPYA